LKIAVVGDSISVAYISTPGPCGMNTGIVCDFIINDATAWPAALARRTGATVVNLAVAGAETTVVSPKGEPPIKNQVPLIDPATQVVIFEGGTNDLGYGSTDYNRVNKIADMIGKQAPQARLVFLGVRYFWHSLPARVDAWDAREKLQARRHGGIFVDTRIFPRNDYADFPDRTHPSPGGVIKLAILVQRALR
jgi:lysophospholipase L1-like esterase